MSFTELRRRYRQLLSDNACYLPASVFDPISARIAQFLGFEAALLAGSNASATILGAPDNCTITLSELVEQARRICRACELPVMVDADHGYGNAFNVMRTVTELEIAGASALSLEDVQLPRAYGGKNTPALISMDEMVGKLRAAANARRDKELVLIARTDSPKYERPEKTIQRVRAYQQTGVDALLLAGLKTREQLDLISEGVALPLMLGAPGPELEAADYLITKRVRIILNQHSASPHSPFYAAVKAVFETLKFQRENGFQWAQANTGIPEDLIDIALRRNAFKEWEREFL